RCELTDEKRLVRKLDAGKPPVQFDERGVETGPPATAPLLDSTLPPTRCDRILRGKSVGAESRNRSDPFSRPFSRPCSSRGATPDYWIGGVLGAAAGWFCDRDGADRPRLGGEARGIVRQPGPPGHRPGGVN